MGNEIKLNTAEQFVYSRGQNDIPAAQRDSFIFIPESRDWINHILVHFLELPMSESLNDVPPCPSALPSQQFTKTNYCINFEGAL